MNVLVLFGGCSSEYEVSLASAAGVLRAMEGRFDALRVGITREAADLALKQMEVDQLGLDAIDRRMLTAIIQNYGGGPVGLETLAATIGEEAVTLEDIYEPYLMQLGFLTRTPRGRCATPAAYDHLHIPFEGQTQFSF